MCKIKTIQKGDYTVKIYTDDYAENPREWDNMWQLVSNYRRIDLNESEFTLDEIAERHKALELTHIIVPVYMYQHGGVALSLGSFVGRAPHAEWDSGVGFFAIVSKERLRHEYGVRAITEKIRECAIRVLRVEVETYGAYLNGDVYGYVIEDEDGNEVDSCWGLYGYEYAVEEALANVPEVVEAV